MAQFTRNTDPEKHPIIIIVVVERKRGIVLLTLIMLITEWVDNKSTSHEGIISCKLNKHF
jgi:hypothetical protein